MQEDNEMFQLILGKSNLEVSALGMGCWAIGGPWDGPSPGRKLPGGLGRHR